MGSAYKEKHLNADRRSFRGCFAAGGSKAFVKIHDGVSSAKLRGILRLPGG